jgi:hypothetical protein
MHFQVKNILKNNRNHTPKHAHIWKNPAIEPILQPFQ